MIDLRLLGDFARRRWWVFALTAPVLIVLMAPESETLNLYHYHLLTLFAVVGGLAATSLDYLIGGGSRVLATLPVRRRSLANSLYLLAAVLPATTAATVFLVGMPLIGVFRQWEARPTDVLVSALAAVALASVFLLLIPRFRRDLNNVSVSPGFFLATQALVLFLFTGHMLKGEFLGFQTAWMLWPAVAVGTVATVSAWWRMPSLLAPAVERPAGQRGLAGRWNRGWAAWRPSRSAEVFLFGALFTSVIALPVALLAPGYRTFTFFAIWLALAAGTARVFGRWLGALRTLRLLPLTARGLSLLPLKEMSFLMMGWGIAGGVILVARGDPARLVLLPSLAALQVAVAMLVACVGLLSGVSSRWLLIAVGAGSVYPAPVLITVAVLMGWTRGLGGSPVTIDLVLVVGALVSFVVSIAGLALALWWMPALLQRASGAYRPLGLGQR